LRETGVTIHVFYLFILKESYSLVVCNSFFSICKKIIAEKKEKGLITKTEKNGSAINVRKIRQCVVFL
jgi:hypothetical protein